MLKIDNVEYDGVNCRVVGLTESFSLVEGKSSKRLQSGNKWYEIIGTETTHSITLVRDDSLSYVNWEALWSKLKEPVDYHTFEFPGTPAYKGHITGGSRSLDYVDGNNSYFGDYTITIEPCEIQEVAD